MNFTGDFMAIMDASHLVLAAYEQAKERAEDPLPTEAELVFKPAINAAGIAGFRDAVATVGARKRDWNDEKWQFVVTAATPIMMVMTRAFDEEDLREQLSQMIVARLPDGEAIRLGDDRYFIGLMDALMEELREAFNPNLVQTQEGAPVVEHLGPYGNIGQGVVSLRDILLGRWLAGPDGFAFLEGGFSSELGFWKIINAIYAQWLKLLNERLAELDALNQGSELNADQLREQAELQAVVKVLHQIVEALRPDGAILILTVKALKQQGGVAPNQLHLPNPEAVKQGLEVNADWHAYANIQEEHNLPMVVGINRFEDQDTDGELQVIVDHFGGEGVPEDRKVPVHVMRNYAQGGFGATELAQAIIDLPEPDPGQKVTPMYQGQALDRQIINYAKHLGYGGAELQPKAAEALAQAEQEGWSNIPILPSKPQQSISGRTAGPGGPPVLGTAHSNEKMKVLDIEFSPAGFAIVHIEKKADFLLNPRQGVSPRTEWTEPERLALALEAFHRGNSWTTPSPPKYLFRPENAGLALLLPEGSTLKIVVANREQADMLKKLRPTLAKDILIPERFGAVAAKLAEARQLLGDGFVEVDLTLDSNRYVLFEQAQGWRDGQHISGPLLLDDEMDAVLLGTQV